MNVLLCFVFLVMGDFFLIQTPTGEKVYLSCISEEKKQDLLLSNNVVFKDRIKLSYEYYPVYEFENGIKLLCYPSGGILFPNRDDFNKVYNDKVGDFSVFKMIGSKPSYYFILSSNFSESISQDYFEFSESKHGFSFRINNLGNCLMLRLPSMHNSIWFPNMECFQLYDKEFLSDTFYRFEKVKKNLYSNREDFKCQFLRLSESKCKAILSKDSIVKSFNDDLLEMKCNELSSGKYLLEDDFYFLLFNNFKQYKSFQEGNIEMESNSSVKKLVDFHFIDSTKLDHSLSSLEYVGGEINKYYMTDTFRNILLKPLSDYYYEVLISSFSKKLKISQSELEVLIEEELSEYEDRPIWLNIILGKDIFVE